MDNSLRVSNIQRVCFHDGPGIRTTIFLSSCPLKCPWCANPETSIAYSNKLSNNKIYDISKLEQIILKDKFLYGDEGGVTFSGGEPLVQSNNLAVLMKRLKQEDINIAIETCLNVKKELLEKVIEYIDLFIVDIKILDSKNALMVLNANLNLFLENIDYIFSENKDVIFRIPLIYPYITNEENLNKIYEFLGNYKPKKIELFKGHNLAKEKYQKLGLEYKNVETINDDEIKDIKKTIEKLNINVEIISF